jgi:hypothetical protein
MVKREKGWLLFDRLAGCILDLVGGPESMSDTKSPDQALLEHVANLQSQQQLEREKKAIADGAKLSVGGAAILIVLAIGFFMLATNNRRSGTTPATPTSYSSKPDVSAPITYAQGFVRRRLKSPSSASFPWSFDEYNVTDLGLGHWRVSGYVDAQNGFGATIRTHWSVEMQDEGASWKLLDASIE